MVAEGRRALKAVKALCRPISRPILSVLFKSKFAIRYRKEVVKKARHSELKTF